LLLPPGAWETPDFWDGFDVHRVASIAEGVARCDLAVLPAWIEHQPRGLLLAIAAGKPVIATAACGLPDHLSWQCVDEGDVVRLRDAIRATLALI
jgi:glycosyltransferase involved in cell wall biosynthesis